MQQLEVIDGYEIFSNGQKVWVNGPDGASAARFSIVSIDIHKPFARQLVEDDPCLDCKDGPCDLTMWGYFKDAVAKHFKVVVDDRHKPKYLKEGPMSHETPRR